MPDQRAERDVCRVCRVPVPDHAVGCSAFACRGASLITAERWRQMQREGWSPEHDVDEHDAGQLARAASCYVKAALIAGNAEHDEAVVRRTLIRLGHDPEQDEDYRQMVEHPVRHYYGEGIAPSEWPWAVEWWKPSTDPVRNLVKAGALVAAEIDRLQRASKNSPSTSGTTNDPPERHLGPPVPSLSQPAKEAE